MKKILMLLGLCLVSITMIGCKDSKLTKIKVAEVARSVFYAWLHSGDRAHLKICGKYKKQVHPLSIKNFGFREKVLHLLFFM